MRVRIRRFTESGTETLALDFPLSRAEDGSTLCTTPIGFTHFICTIVPLSEAFGLLCSSCELLILLILSMFSPSQRTSTWLVSGRRRRPIVQAALRPPLKPSVRLSRTGLSQRYVVVRAAHQLVRHGQPVRLLRCFNCMFPPILAYGGVTKETYPHQ